MKCPECNSTQTVKNGHRKGRQCYKCKQCDRQFLEFYRPWQYSQKIKLECLNLYIEGMGIRAIERLTNIHHTTILSWIRQAGLETLSCSKSNKFLN
jgi:transposase-like protein